MTSLQKRCADISFRHKLTHVSSVLNTVHVLDDIYANRKDGDPVVLGNSHAALALWVVLEKYGLCDAEDMLGRYGTHACRDMEHGVWVSGGSLGQAETVAVGLALGDPHHETWLVTSDGACMEGAVAEAFRLASKWCSNLSVRVVFNGCGGYSAIPLEDINMIVYPLGSKCWIHSVHQDNYPEWLRGLEGHYLTLTQSQYEELMR